MTPTKTPLTQKIGLHMQNFQNVLGEMKQIRGKQRIGKQFQKSRKNLQHIMS